MSEVVPISGKTLLDKLDVARFSSHRMAEGLLVTRACMGVARVSGMTKMIAA